MTFTVAICTRNRSEILRATLDALEPQLDGRFRVLVVDQSDAPDAELLRRREPPEFTVIRDSGRGLSRARNIAWRSAQDPWVVHDRAARWLGRALGAGPTLFPSAEDMDFNYRLLRAGGVAFVTPRVRARHEQWRAPHELGQHLGGYMEGWSGFAMKHLRSGDLLGGLWLWHWGLRDTARMFGSAAKRRSLLRLRIAAYKAAGLARGTWRGAWRSW